MLHCPHCQQTIERPTSAPEDETLSVAVSCPHCGSGFRLISAVETRTGDAPRAQRVAHFRLQRILGRGAFGIVWLAEDEKLHRPVALKLSRMMSDMAFLHEARTAAQLRHEHIVTVHDVGTDGDHMYIASDFIDGISLRDRLGGGRVPRREAIDLCIDLADAVAHAHTHGIVHRDLKPSNILLDVSGRPYVADFGIAKYEADEVTITREGEIVGTPDYMSPEQARGQGSQVDRRSDVYALGVILFELLTGEKPFRGNSRAVMHQKMHDEPPSPRKLDPRLPKDLETICLKCLEREPGRRYQTASEVRDELTRHREQRPIHARPVSPPERAWRWCRRNPVMSGLLAALFLSLTTGLAGVTFYWTRAETSAAEAERALYRARIGLIEGAWRAGDVDSVRGLLNAYAPPSPNAGLRRFEWRVFDNLIAPFGATAQHGESIIDVALDSSRHRMASAGLDGMVRVWDTESGAKLHEFEGSSADVTTILFWTGTGQLITTDDAGTIRLGSAGDPAQPERRWNHGAAVTSARVHSEENVLVTAGGDGSIRLWTLPEGKAAGEIHSRQPIMQLNLSSRGDRIVASCADGRVRVWDAATREPLADLGPNGKTNAVAISPDGERVIVGTYSGALREWSVPEGKLLRNAIHEAGPYGDLEYSGDGRLLYGIANDGRLRVLDADSLQVRNHVYTHTLSNGCLAVSPRGDLAVAAGGDGVLKVVRLADLRRRSLIWEGTLDETDAVRDLAFVPGSTQFVAGTQHGALAIWDAADGSEARRLRSAGGGQLLTVATDPQGKRVAAAGASDVITVWELAADSRPKTLRSHRANLSALAFSPSGRRLAAGSRANHVTVFDVDEGVIAWEQALPGEQVAAVTFLDTDDLVAVAVGDGVRLHQLPTGELQRTIAGAKDDLITSLVYVPQRRMLALGTQSGTIHLRGLTNDGTPRSLQSHSGRINRLAVFPDGTTLASGGRDKIVRLWDLETGDLRGNLAGHARQVFALGVSSDGQTLASGSLAGDIQLWRGGR